MGRRSLWHRPRQREARLPLGRRRGLPGAALRLLVAGKENLGWQRGQLLPRRGDDDDWTDDRAEQTNNALEHELGAKRQRRLGAAHAGALPAGEDETRYAGDFRL